MPSTSAVIETASPLEKTLNVANNVDRQAICEDASRCSPYLNTDPDGYVRSFFPATSSEFVPQCGAVKSVKVSDFEDENRRRHLEAFQKSWRGNEVGKRLNLGFER